MWFILILEGSNWSTLSVAWLGVVKYNSWPVPIFTFIWPLAMFCNRWHAMYKWHHLLYMAARLDIQIYSCEYNRMKEIIFHDEFPCNLHAKGFSWYFTWHSLSHYWECSGGTNNELHWPKKLLLHFSQVCVITVSSAIERASGNLTSQLWGGCLNHLVTTSGYPLLNLTWKSGEFLFWGIVHTGIMRK